jgi:hypothetical protein
MRSSSVTWYCRRRLRRSAPVGACCSVVIA